MTWMKQGVFFTPPGTGWMTSHAAIPVGCPGNPNRVYFSSRDEQGRAHIGWLTLDWNHPGQDVVASEKAAIEPGPLGTFDDSGVTSSCVVQVGTQLYHYYSGWSLGRTVPFYLAIGLAISDDNGRTFRKWSPAPLLDRSAADPYLTASPCVLWDRGRFRMWYVAGTEWRMEGGRPQHSYLIKHAESDDGLQWTRPGTICIDYRPGENAIARPWVIKEGGLYRMWYSYRGAAYRIGYAESGDGLDWKRCDDEGGLEPSASGWDSEMVEYAWVVRRDDRRMMLYNGNDYGRTGIGWAVDPGPAQP
jgi:hypothetical protein